MRRSVAILICIVVTLYPFVVFADVKIGDQGTEVKQVQEQLKGFGYTITVDGIFGKQTDKIVRLWQKANGLKVDGIVGPITAGTLAKRGTQIQVTTPPSPPGPPGGLSLCDEMSWYRQDVGLPAIFDSIGWRESNCQNDAPPSIPEARCCRGWWAIHYTNIRAPGYKAGAAACGITTESDYYGTSFEQKKASACFAKVLYDVSGLTPWAT